MIVRKKKYDSITSTLRDVLHWLPIRQRVDYKLGVLMFNCRHNLAPGYLTTMCHAVSENPGRHNLRLAARQDLMVPPTRTVCYTVPVASLTQDRQHGTPWQRHSGINNCQSLQ